MLYFFFAHRVHWFLSVMINNAEENKENIIEFLKMISTLFKSENKEKRNKIEYFYISNSEPYIKYIESNELYFLYDNKSYKSLEAENDDDNIFNSINFNSLNMFQQIIYNKYKKNRDKIIAFSDREYYLIKNRQERKLQANMKKKNIYESNDS